MCEFDAHWCSVRADRVRNQGGIDERALRCASLAGRCSVKAYDCDATLREQILAIRIGNSHRHSTLVDDAPDPGFGMFRIDRYGSATRLADCNEPNGALETRCTQRDWH